MTVSANSALDYQRDQLIRMSYQLTGLLEAGREPSAADLSMASDFMNLELMSLQADGVILRTIERATLTLVAGTAEYTLPSDTIDVQLGPNDQFGSIIPASGGETMVMAMTRAEWLDLSDKSSNTTGRPTRAYLERQATVTATLWPVPDASAVSLRYSRVRLLRDADTGAVTLDLARRWLKFVAYATAVHLGRAKSITSDAIKGLEIQADKLKKACLADDNQRGKLRFRLAHVGRHW